MGGFVAYEDEQRVTSVRSDDLDPSKMTDDDLRDEISSIYVEVKDITQQLLDNQEAGVGFSRGMDWSSRARTARRFMLRRVDKLRAEATARGIPELVPERAVFESFLSAKKEVHLATVERKKARTIAHLLGAQENIARKAAARERHKELVDLAERRKNEREVRHHELLLAAKTLESHRSYLFLQAANQVLSKRDLERIWAKAKEMFPDRGDWGPGLS